MSRLNHFIQELATNPEMLSAYQSNAEQTMLKSGLSKREVQAVLAGDKSQLDTLSGHQQPKTAYYFSNILPAMEHSEAGQPAANLH